jgi:VanZ family protein
VLSIEEEAIVIAFRRHTLLPLGGPGPFQKLLQSWADAPVLGDFLRNTAAYTVLAFFATKAFACTRARLHRAPIVVAAGAACSVSFEFAQYFLPGRYTSAMDVYADTLGLLIGSAVAVLSR